MALSCETFAPAKRPAGWAGGAVFPTTQDAWEDYARWTADPDAVAQIATWHERHLFGNLSSNLALPSLVLVPEPPYFLIEVDDLPLQGDPSVEFHAARPSAPPWPWLASLSWAQVTATLEQFVSDCLARGRDAGGEHRWADWVEGRFRQARLAAADPAQRLQGQFGPVVSAHLAQLPPASAAREAAEGVFRDTAPGDTAATARTTQDWIDTVVADTSASPARWLLPDLPYDLAQAPFEQGYLLARHVRERLRQPDRPLDLDHLLFELDVEPRREAATAAIETAVVGVPRRRACLLSNTASTERRLQRWHGRRFAEAAALGRLLAAAGGDGGTAVGAAQGPHTLPVAGRRARAFAAELLLPSSVARGYAPTDDLQTLCAEYGISQLAAQWHILNVAAAA
ncbi:MAG: hypothetical protein IT204_10065 [Fimbriimonadaceae bacterium]|nr:hypothetical protein [Fimbriimonadaceae bacterium]